MDGQSNTPRDNSRHQRGNTNPVHLLEKDYKITGVLKGKPKGLLEYEIVRLTGLPRDSVYGGLRRLEKLDPQIVFRVPLENRDYWCLNDENLKKTLHIQMVQKADKEYAFTKYPHRRYGLNQMEKLIEKTIPKKTPMSEIEGWIALLKMRRLLGRKLENIGKKLQK